MASRSVLLGCFTLRIKGDHAYRSSVKVGDRLFCAIDPDNKHSDNTTVKSGNDDIVGHVPETIAKKLFNFMKSQAIEIMDSEVTGDDPRPAPEGKWVIGGGIEIPSKYRLYGPKSIKKEVRAALK